MPPGILPRNPVSEVLPSTSKSSAVRAIGSSFFMWLSTESSYQVGAIDTWGVAHDAGPFSRFCTARKGHRTALYKPALTGEVGIPHKVNAVGYGSTRKFHFTVWQHNYSLYAEAMARRALTRTSSNRTVPPSGTCLGSRSASGRALDEFQNKGGHNIVENAPELLS